MSVPDEIEMLPPWSAIPESPDQQQVAEMLAARLKSDLPEGHVLQGFALKAVARRSDQDDVLFEAAGAEILLALVHMTWCKETDPRWPRTRIFRSWRDFVDRAMIPDHDNFARGTL